MKKDIDMRFFANARLVPRDDFERKSFHFRSPEVIKKPYFHEKSAKILTSAHIFPPEWS